VRSVAFSPDGARLASGGEDGTVRVWDARAGQEALILQGHTGFVTAVCFGPNGHRLAIASSDKTVKVWDTLAGQVTLTFKGHTFPVSAVAFSPDGTRLASASERSPDQRFLEFGELSPEQPGGVGYVKVWDAQTGQEFLTLKEGVGRVTAVCFSPDGARLASGGGDGTVKVWDARTGQELLTLRGHSSRVRSVAFSPDGARLASAGGEWHKPGEVKLWDARTGQELLSLRGHTKGVGSVAFSPDSARLASVSDDGTVKEWDQRSGQQLLTLRWHTGRLSGVAFSPDGRRIVSVGIATGQQPCEVKVWEARSGQELLTLRAHRANVLGVAFSPDGTRLASAFTDGTVQVWEAISVPSDVMQQRVIIGYVQSLFETLRLKAEVVTRLRKDRTLSDPERELALRVVQGFREDPEELDRAAREVARSRDLARERYDLAHRQVEEAVRLAPGNGLFLNTLGVAQYRVGQYAEAVATLTQSDKFNAARFKSSIPADLAFLAMAQHQLGRKEQAQATFGRLRDALMKQPFWAKDAEAPGFLREAEALLQGKP
jgi:WD40 repeat protein